ncbi:MAG: daunorubicin resistance protein DrrA family ABC transporter ATP-binding protein [Pelotomaculum sp.]|uniref:ABC-type multidrug transport system, ATPase component n=1 Tax=Pelotomaculum thermopropionicum (strain DSM 13744 / JCM 10971 / SI) TaxID=370438 RepID=A5D481_PELTS|nr:daunorubicin resistance protein DrrA family ABC transporter ATP-binding protein [Pelotomaculum sp.]BAF58958.1 ABC-type multidrug transport system, ATPase component [Pelotomaculum thermopropionicum SI]
MSIINIENLVKKFGNFAAVRGISFSVSEGEIFGFLGPNGAGKSTTIKILSTLLKPTSGKAELAGYDVVAHPNEVRRSIGMVFQDPSLDNRLTAEENLLFHAMLYNVPANLIRPRIDQVLEIVDLADRRRSLVKTFSGGMKRRLEIARGLLHRPKVLFLDEPTAGLDPQTRNAIWEHVRKLRDETGITVFMTTHYMDEAENCDRIAVIDHGAIQAIDSPAALKRMLGGDKIIVRGDPALQKDLEARYGIAVREADGECHFLVRGGAEFVPLVVSDFNGRIKSIQVKEPSLDDVFLHLTGRAIRDEEGSVKDIMRQRLLSRRGRH